MTQSAAALAAQLPDTPKTGMKRTPPVEELYRDLIKAGLVRIVRRRGKPPLIQWL